MENPWKNHNILKTETFNFDEFMMHSTPTHGLETKWKENGKIITSKKRGGVSSLKLCENNNFVSHSQTDLSHFCY
jgi:hypothetical protein